LNTIGGFSKNPPLGQESAVKSLDSRSVGADAKSRDSRDTDPFGDVLAALSESKGARQSGPASPPSPQFRSNAYLLRSQAEAPSAQGLIEPSPRPSVDSFHAAASGSVQVQAGLVHVPQSQAEGPSEQGLIETSPRPSVDSFHAAASGSVRVQAGLVPDVPLTSVEASVEQDPVEPSTTPSLELPLPPSSGPITESVAAEPEAKSLEFAGKAVSSVRGAIDSGRAMQAAVTTSSIDEAGETLRRDPISPGRATVSMAAVGEVNKDQGESEGRDRQIGRQSSLNQFSVAPRDNRFVTRSAKSKADAEENAMSSMPQALSANMELQASLSADHVTRDPSVSTTALDGSAPVAPAATVQSARKSSTTKSPDVSADALWGEAKGVSYTSPKAATTSQKPLSGFTADAIGAGTTSSSTDKVDSAQDQDPAVSILQVPVSVLDQQTHFMPPTGLAPIQQIADAVVAGLPRTAGTTPIAEANILTPGVDSQIQGSISSPAPGAISLNGSNAITRRPASVKVLNLTLEPQSLGSVTIKMRLSGTALNVEVELHRPDAMRLIDKDKDLLVAKLQSSGYAIDTLVIKPAASQPAHFTSVQGASSQGGSDAFASSGNSAGNGFGHGQATGSSQSQSGDQTGDDHSSPAAAVAEDLQDTTRMSNPRGDLYI